MGLKNKRASKSLARDVADGFLTREEAHKNLAKARETGELHFDAPYVNRAAGDHRQLDKEIDKATGKKTPDRGEWSLINQSDAHTLGPQAAKARERATKILTGQVSKSHALSQGSEAEQEATKKALEDLTKRHKAAEKKRHKKKKRPCPYPWSLDKKGNRCGKRSAYSKGATRGYDISEEKAAQLKGLGSNKLPFEMNGVNVKKYPPLSFRQNLPNGDDVLDAIHMGRAYIRARQDGRRNRAIPTGEKLETDRKVVGGWPAKLGAIDGCEADWRGLARQGRAW